MAESPDIFGSEPAPDGETPATRADEPLPQPTSAPAQPYRVLARKYRPQTFAELIGQEPMVRTLGNAIRRNRLAHAFLMTGVRGVGKTSTARLIAKALNCIGADGRGGPTIDPCGTCEPCRAIAEGRHIDVIEMDAASHTGIDDVREIIEAVRYAAVSARYKIYIIDEVHMLSKAAFNGLLKTLEEPPAHVKFLFATTEADKLPVTVLSRCQRFDLRRISTETLVENFAMICRAEGVDAEAEALAMIARAAEGSARDGQSILDQAIAHADLDGGGSVTAVKVAEMLGLADKTVQRRLLAALLAGDGATLLDLVARQHSLGVEPQALLRSQLDLVHRITVHQLGGSVDAPSSEEREAIAGWAQQLAAGQLHRLWQLLLKGHDEVRLAPDPTAAAQMALLRVMHAADLPDPAGLVRKLEELAARPAPTSAAVTEAPVAVSASLDWAELIERVRNAGHLRVGQLMHDWLRPIEVTTGLLRYQLAPGLRDDPVAELRDVLLKLTGERWQVERTTGEARPSLREVAESTARAARAAVLADPLVKAAFAAFPEAELIDDEAQAPGRADPPWHITPRSQHA